MKLLKTATALLAIPFLFAFAAIAISQTNQVVQLASTVSPVLGKVVLVVVACSFLGLLAIPIILFVTLPKPLVPPASDEGPEFERYLEILKRRLSGNALMAERALETRNDVEGALSHLGNRADAVTRDTASMLFLITAVSQSGRLDGLVVLAAQSRMIWRIAHIYYQRPTAADMARLYANVAATALIASSIDDLNLEEQLDPIIGATVGTALGVVPGMTAAATMLSSAILTGSANAFLTLRVGIIARRYCGSLVRAERRTIRKAAAVEAIRLLPPLAWEGSKKIGAATGRVMKSKVWRRKKDAAEIVAPANP